jgi:hypothetical protein
VEEGCVERGQFLGTLHGANCTPERMAGNSIVR